MLMVQFLNSNIKFVKDWEKNYKKVGSVGLFNCSSSLVLSM